MKSKPKSAAPANCEDFPAIEAYNAHLQERLKIRWDALSPEERAAREERFKQQDQKSAQRLEQLQQESHKVLALLSKGALPGSPGAAFEVGLQTRKREADRLGWTDTKFNDSSPADLRSDILVKAANDLATANINEMLSASSGSGVPDNNQCLPVDRTALYKQATTRHPEWKKRGGIAAWCQNNTLNYQNFRKWIRDDTRNETGKSRYPDSSPFAVRCVKALQK